MPQYPDEQAQMSAGQQNAHEQIEEIVHTAAENRLPLQLGTVPAKWKDTGEEVWIIGRANPDAAGPGGVQIEPMAVAMDDSLMQRIDFGYPVHKVGRDERSQREVKAQFGLPVPADDAGLAVDRKVDEALSGIEQVIEAMLQGNKPVQTVRVSTDPDTGKVQLNPIASWPFDPQVPND